MFSTVFVFFLYMWIKNKKTSNHKLASTKLGHLQLEEGEPQRGRCGVRTEPITLYFTALWPMPGVINMTHFYWITKNKMTFDFCCLKWKVKKKEFLCQKVFSFSFKFPQNKLLNCIHLGHFGRIALHLVEFGKLIHGSFQIELEGKTHSPTTNQWMITESGHF